MERKRGSHKKEAYIWVLLRIAIGWLFLWAFFDKLFGLGFNTASDKSWINGVSPTAGFLKLGTHGIFSGFYNSLTGSVVIDWIFMIGLLLLGLGLIFGIYVKIAAYAGALLMFLIWTALTPPEHNPIIDEHIVYLLVLIGIAISKSSLEFSLEKRFIKKE
ncbi:DoxX family membrane protein [Candidatus Woesearchaeota archaeon]|nr:DoxX family membrane protein [Candidatus Woesearchaeota archaeon]